MIHNTLHASDIHHRWMSHISQYPVKKEYTHIPFCRIGLVLAIELHALEYLGNY